MVAQHLNEAWADARTIRVPLSNPLVRGRVPRRSQDAPTLKERTASKSAMMPKCGAARPQ